MAKKMNRDMPLPSSDGMFGGPGKSGPNKKSPSSMFSTPTLSFSTPKKETYESRRSDRKTLIQKKKALREAYMHPKATTLGDNTMSKDEYKQKLSAINEQIQSTRKIGDKVVAAKTKIRQALKSKRRKGSGSFGSTSGCGVNAKGGSCKAGRNKTLGGKF